MPDIKELNRIALKLLLVETPELSFSEAESLDMGAKTAEFSGDQEEAYEKRVLAARTFTRLRALKDAAFSYDRAAKQAEGLGFLMPAIICRIRACRIYNSLGFSEDSKEMTYACDHLAGIVRKYSSSELENGTEYPVTCYKNPYYRKYRKRVI
jgi:hypothetical protein